MVKPIVRHVNVLRHRTVVTVDLRTLAGNVSLDQQRASLRISGMTNFSLRMAGSGSAAEMREAVDDIEGASA